MFHFLFSVFNFLAWDIHFSISDIPVSRNLISEISVAVLLLGVHFPIWVFHLLL